MISSMISSLLLLQSEVMKALVVYASQTGFTKKYAEWLSERLNGESMDIKTAEAKSNDFFKSYDTIVFGGWANAGKVTKSNWFISRIDDWKNKKLALFCVGASPQDGPHVDEMMEKILTPEQKKLVKTFYCQGGLNYDKMSFGSRLAMKAFAAILKKKKAENEAEKRMAEMVSNNYDISNPKFIEPIVSYLEA